MVQHDAHQAGSQAHRALRLIQQCEPVLHHGLCELHHQLQQVRDALPGDGAGGDNVDIAARVRILPVQRHIEALQASSTAGSTTGSTAGSAESMCHADSRGDEKRIGKVQATG